MIIVSPAGETKGEPLATSNRRHDRDLSDLHGRIIMGAPISAKTAATLALLTTRPATPIVSDSRFWVACHHRGG